jgi:agmatinase
MKPFGGLPKKYTQFEKSAVLLQSIPYDGTSTWGKGADKGFDAFIEASENLELYDIETDSEVFRKGIHTLPEISENASPEAVFEAVYERTRELLQNEKFLTFFGGEHSISIGVIKAFYEHFPNLTVLQLDAHADLRESYLGSQYNHACALHDASRHANLVQVGIRSMDVSEKEYLDKEKCYFAEEMEGNYEWVKRSIRQMTEKVYITIDLDVFDPAIMPATGTPEPGGLDWYTVIQYLREVFRLKQVVGFDIVELAPVNDNKAPEFLAAKLYYKLLSYKFKYERKHSQNIK